MVYISNTGSVHETEPWSLSSIPKIFWGVLNSITFFVQTLISPDMPQPKGGNRALTSGGNKASGHRLGGNNVNRDSSGGVGSNVKGMSNLPQCGPTAKSCGRRSLRCVLLIFFHLKSFQHGNNEMLRLRAKRKESLFLMKFVKDTASIALATAFHSFQLHSIFACPKLRLQVFLLVNYRCPVAIPLIVFCQEEKLTKHQRAYHVNLIMLVKRGSISVRFSSHKAYTRVEGALIIDQKAGNEESQNYGYISIWQGNRAIQEQPDQNRSLDMSTQGNLRIGDTAPDFTAESSAGEFKLYDYLGDHWGVFFSHPADFTPVCTTELGAVAKLLPEFEKRNTKVFALSVDPLDKHHKWIDDINETQNTKVTYPIIADHDRKVATLYGMLDPTNLQKTTGLPVTVRSVFIIDPKRAVRLILTYPASCGRNFDEVLRTLDSLQTTDKHKVATPANWNKGDDLIVLASLNNDQAREAFGDFKEVRPYLRYVKNDQLKGQ
ncbi:anti-oxidant AhpCTSA family protein [Planoprotostelium fungivorum]|uniref:Anti-oxidant AhpCTSA family protein n=1 Tax=Planoprotostelium fungivorum TaxID=1890364 RepID=A0A2P6NWR7_9EUKA|nr:anti-oxidant AhpCTSA family protein [Planoprotostelium fungivorum]